MSKNDSIRILKQWKGAIRNSERNERWQTTDGVSNRKKLFKSLPDIGANMSIKVPFFQILLDKFPDNSGDVSDDHVVEHGSSGNKLLNDSWNCVHVTMNI